MSLVGPRPPLPDEVADYDLWHRRRLSMKPGITGLWQVRGRRDPDFDHWVEADLEYIDKWSLWLDVQILFRTIPAALEGASGHARRRGRSRCVSSGASETLGKAVNRTNSIPTPSRKSRSSGSKKYLTVCCSSTSSSWLPRTDRW